MSRFNTPAALRKPASWRRNEQLVAAPLAPQAGLKGPVLQPELQSSRMATPSVPAMPAATTGVLSSIGFAAALAYIFLRFALLNDAVTYIFGFKAYLSYITAPIALLGVVFGGGLTRAVRFKPGVFFCGFLTWLLIAIPFSVWMGGSIQTLFTAFEADFSIFFMIVGLTTTWERFRTVMVVIAWGGVCDFLLCLLYPSSGDGRFALSFGTLANPNDLATHFLFILPICIWVSIASRGFSVAKVVMPLTIVGILVIVLRTGSRAALLSLIGLSLYLFLRGSVKLKIIATASAVVLIAVALVALPADLRYRYLSLFSSDKPTPTTETDMERVKEADGSTAAREALLFNSVSETFKHPLFGVGPGQFAVAEAAVAKDLGKHATWQLTHNTYTQVSSEAGIPAFLFFIAALFGSMSLLYRVHRRAKSHPLLSAATFWLLISAIGFSINIFFSALAYSAYVPTLIALSMVAASMGKGDGEMPARPIR